MVVIERKKVIQERIEKIRITKGWTRSHLADEIGISKNSVYAWFGEKARVPSIANIQSICEACGITMTEFFSEIDTNKPAVKEILLVEAFRKVPSEQQNQVLQIVKSFGKELVLQEWVSTVAVVDTHFIINP